MAFGDKTLKQVDAFERLMQSLKQRQFANVYVLCGEEPYYIDQACNWLEKNLLDEAAREFDQTVLYGRDLEPAHSPDIAQAISMARGFSMFGDRKVVIVKEAQAVSKWGALDLYLDNPQPNSVLVICYKGKIDGRIGVWKKAAKAGVVYTSNPLATYEVERWIMGYIAERNRELKAAGNDVQISPAVTHLLAESLGTDLSAIVGALNKLIDGRPAGVREIDTKLVERNVGISKDFNVFELQNALMVGDILKANRITQFFSTSKDHPMVKELPQVYRFFQNLLMFHYLPDKSPSVAAAELGVNPYFVKDYVQAAQRYSAGKVFRIIGYIRDIDARSKGMNNPSANDADLWKELIYKIMH